MLQLDKESGETEARVPLKKLNRCLQVKADGFNSKFEAKPGIKSGPQGVVSSKQRVARSNRARDALKLLSSNSEYQVLEPDLVEIVGRVVLSLMSKKALKL